jgi:hypothetical protein
MADSKPKAKEDVKPSENPSKGATKVVDGQEVSKMGVAIFPEGMHPKDRQLAAKKLADAKSSEAEVPVVASESVVDQMPRSTRVSKKEQAAAGEKVKGELEAAEELESGKLDKDEEKAKKDAEAEKQKKIDEAQKEVDSKKV